MLVLTTNQRPKNHRGIVALPSGKFLRVRKVFARNPFALGSFHTVWKISGLSRWSGKVPDSLENFRIVWKISGWSQKFPDGPESFRTIRKFSRLSGTFPDHLDNPEIFQTVWKLPSAKGLRAKTFRMAMPRCHDGFWASVLM